MSEVPTQYKQSLFTAFKKETKQSQDQSQPTSHILTSYVDRNDVDSRAKDHVNSHANAGSGTGGDHANTHSNDWYDPKDKLTNDISMLCQK